MSLMKTSVCDAGGHCYDGRGGEIVKMGYLRKLKTMKKRFFILRGDSSEASARLEYYEDEKKWKKNHSPRRAISLKTCFNINRRQDTKHKYVIALYTKDDCFGLVLDSEEELEDWLKALLSLQYGEDIVDGEEPKPTFEHVWQVTVLNKGLGNTRNILGRHLLCLTDRSLSLVKLSQEERAETYEFSLVSIRRCGRSDCFFYMEVGRSSCTGEGELWMQTEDTNIADNMHAAILHAMSNNSSKEEQVPRPRSSSTNEVSKPIAMLQRRQTHVGNSSVKEAVLLTSSTTRAMPTNEVDSHGQPHQALSCVGSGGAGTHQRTYSFPLSEPGPRTPWESRRGSTGRTNKRTSGSINVHSSGRERSDSVPSRTRTISDGPHPLPHLHTSHSLFPNSGNSRPHSVCWPAGSPVSPASGPCSTDSPGSSVSIEEGDGEGWAGYGHSLTPDEPVILEENCSDDIAWPGSMSLLLPVRKLSPSQVPTSISAGSPSQDAYSLHSSSPLDPLGGYMTMIQHDTGTGVSEASARRHAPSSSNHSHASSLAEETPNGYVPMAPMDDGYVDMEPVQLGQRYHGEDYARGEMSPSSSCSITSGTPSTDMRFSEYHLEKVSSYFTPSEEDETSSLDRPMRAYSVGSRPDAMKRTNRLDIVNQTDALRVRAFSVGSRTVNKLSSRALAYDLYMTRQHPMLTPPHHPGGHHLTPTPTAGGKKSLSAPLLCNSWSGGGTLRHHLHGSSHSSVEPMDDLMEMDFTRNSRIKPKANPGGNKLEDRTSVINGYVDMSSRSTASKQADTKSGNMVAASPPKSVIPTISSKTNVDYHAQSPPVPTPVKLIGSSSMSPKNVGPYMEMRPGSSPPAKSSVVQRKTSTVDPPFPEIKVLSSQPTSDGLSDGTQNTSSLSPYMEMKSELYHHSFPVSSGCQNRKPTSPIQEEYMDMAKPSSVESSMGVSTVARTAPVDTPQPKKPPEGYVEMAWTGGSKPSHRSSLETYRSNSEDYMNLSFEGRGNSKRKDKRKGRYSSQPIAIQARELEAGTVTGKSQSSSTSPVYSLSGLIGRKHSSGTPPKVPPPAFLPLGHTSGISPSSSPSSTLRRTHNHKANRRDSIENTGLTTPTGSSVTIFPFSLNSPGSPMKPFPGQQQNKSQLPPLATAPGTDINYELSRKCLVDATSGTVRLSYPGDPYSPESTTTTPDSSSSSSEQPTPVNVESLNDLNKVESPRIHNYVNYSPLHRSKEEPVYAVMRPVPSRKISVPARVMNLKTDSMDLTPIPDSWKPQSTAMFCLSETVSTPKLVTSSTVAPNKEAVQFGRQNVTASDNKVGKVGTIAWQPSGSSTRPADASNIGKISRQPSGSSLGSAEGAISRQLSNSSVESVVAGPASSVSVGSPTSSRPPSVSSERELHYASLDLAPSGSEGEDGSRSPHSIKAQGSLTESSTSSPSPNPVNQGTGESAFTYAEIDFAKSEGLRNVSYSLNRKLRH
ncbi:insulin receptor substrate 1 isoform X3 [Zootermopsis nevadensis]|uniref:insulin receptor substrate 1 isoform X3 n=1 Tax=Zootermopsis nevadensis TaxID=136037 RepID=UPI000B8EB54A|nr:insulin receptor substrate 1 isoform X3 [Zootermopsis nevadensis]